MNDTGNINDTGTATELENFINNMSEESVGVIASAVSKVTETLTKLATTAGSAIQNVTTVAEYVELLDTILYSARSLVDTLESLDNTVKEEIDCQGLNSGTV